MSSPQVQAIVDRIAQLGAPPHILAMIGPALDDMEAHGDVEALPNLARQVEAVGLALEAGDMAAALELAGEWGALAPMLGLAAPAD